MRSTGKWFGFVGTLLLATGCPDAAVPTATGRVEITPAHSVAATLNGPNVITYEHQEVLTNTARAVRQGARLATGGCKFSGQAILAPGTTVTELELAFDPDTCQSLVESGTLVASGSGADPTEIGTEAATHDSTAAGLRMFPVAAVD